MVGPCSTPAAPKGASDSFPDSRPPMVVGAQGKSWVCIRGKKNFDRVFSEGRRIGGRYFTVFLLDGKRDDGPKLGLVVSKKVARAATRRNMIKRIVRESFRHASLSRERGFELVVLARPGQVGTERGELRHAMDRLLLRAAELWNLGEGS